MKKIRTVRKPDKLDPLNHKLTRWEKEILADYKAGKYEVVPQTAADRKRWQEAAKRPPVLFYKGARITLRVNEEDLLALRRRAHAEGKKYQTLIGEILHREAAAYIKAA
jgi:predicted DNA binding CopG/RHH family protein